MTGSVALEQVEIQHVTPGCRLLVWTEVGDLRLLAVVGRTDTDGRVSLWIADGSKIELGEGSRVIGTPA